MDSYEIEVFWQLKELINILESLYLGCKFSRNYIYIYVHGIKASKVIFAVNLKHGREIVEDRNEEIKEMRITD